MDDLVLPKKIILHTWVILSLLRVAKLEKDVSELKKIDHSAKALATLKSQVSTVVKQYLGSKISDDLQKEPVKEPIAEVVMDDAFNISGEDVVHDDDQPQDTSEPKTYKTSNQDCSNNPQGLLILIQNRTSVKLYLIKLNNLGLTICIKIEYNFQKGFNAFTNLIGTIQKEIITPFDLSKPLPRQGKTYTTSITKTKAAQYDIVGIEDMVPTLWSTIKHAKFFGVKSVSVKKLHRHGHLEEVMVKRADRQLHKFKDGDFIDLHLNIIEDMLLLVVQHKLFHLNKSDIIDFIMTFPEMEFKELDNPSYKPPGVIYKDMYKQKRVMWADELYKLSDRTLKKFQDELHHRLLDFCLGYNDKMSRRKWTAIEKKRSKLIVELIDKLMRESQNWRDLPKDISLDRIEVLRYDTKGVKVRKEKMQTKAELTLEQTPQDVSDKFLNIIVMPKSIHNDDGNPSRANIKQALW
nr:hypothetical protein [Tanacetum cinerariifolium]